MNYVKILRILILFFFLSFPSLVNAEQKNVYVDMDLLMNSSLGGKSITQQLDKINQSNLKKFKNLEDGLRTEENEIISKKNVISESEYLKKISLLKKNVFEYNQNKKKINGQLTQKKIKAQAALINSITPILADYAKKNDISMVISKQNIIMGQTELDITDDILKLLNKKITNIKLK